MTVSAANLHERSDLREQALSRWDNEGGALSHHVAASAPLASHALSTAELVHLRVRVIALENIVLALLAHATADQRALVTDVAQIIRPQHGTVPHPLTIEAANLIDAMVERSLRLAPPAA
ncbi:hypothetical protein [Sphingomonas sp. IW22]|uniref:hypothetical protein n=1 Tax=Sphingomonas sp. IW22 TaxID=3242489 RepID=UPI003521D21B